MGKAQYKVNLTLGAILWVCQLQVSQEGQTLDSGDTWSDRDSGQVIHEVSIYGDCLGFLWKE